jgi:hypothetical protein
VLGVQEGHHDGEERAAEQDEDARVVELDHVLRQRRREGDSGGVERVEADERRHADGGVGGCRPDPERESRDEGRHEHPRAAGRVHPAELHAEEREEEGQVDVDGVRGVIDAPAAPQAEQDGGCRHAAEDDPERCVPGAHARVEEYRRGRAAEEAETAAVDRPDAAQKEQVYGAGVLGPDPAVDQIPKCGP